MILFLVATHPDGYMNILLKKCDDVGLSYKVLGMGEKWKGYAWKFNSVLDNLNQLDDNEIVIFTDAYDVLLISSPEEIERRFKEMNTSIVLSIEDAPEGFLIWPYLYRKMFPKIYDKYFVNSGLYMGYAWALKKLFQGIKIQLGLEDTDDDQKKLALFLNANPEFYKRYCKFDTSKRIFYNILHKSLPIEKVNQIDCCFVHGPGNAELKDVIKRFNLEGEMIAQKRNPVVYYSKIIKNYSKYFKTEIVILVIVIIILLFWYLCRKRNLKLKI